MLREMAWIVSCLEGVVAYFEMVVEKGLVGRLGRREVEWHWLRKVALTLSYP